MADMFKGAKPFLFNSAESFRKNPTRAEEKLWTYLRKKPLGIKFRRQHPCLLYVLDFYAHSIKLVIEVDGNIHELEEVKENDTKRQLDIERTGLQIFRVTNQEIECNFTDVTIRIENMIRKLIYPPL